jgi:hypothetical protein
MQNVLKESEGVIPKAKRVKGRTELVEPAVRIPKPRLAQPESPFKFLKRNRPKLIAFKARVAEKYMLLNISCAV